MIEGINYSRCLGSGVQVPPGLWLPVPGRSAYKARCDWCGKWLCVTRQGRIPGHKWTGISVDASDPTERR